MATNDKMLVSAFQDKVAIRSSFNLASMVSYVSHNLITFWDQTILKLPLNGHFEFCNIYLTQEMENDWTINIKQNVMSHTRITNDKFHTKNSKMDFFFNKQFQNSGRAITEGCFRVRFRTTFCRCLMFSRNHGNVLPNWSIVL